MEYLHKSRLRGDLQSFSSHSRSNHSFLTTGCLFDESFFIFIGVSESPIRQQMEEGRNRRLAESQERDVSHGPELSSVWQEIRKQHRCSRALQTNTPLMYKRSERQHGGSFVTCTQLQACLHISLLPEGPLFGVTSAVASWLGGRSKEQLA